MSITTLEPSILLSALAKNTQPIFMGWKSTKNFLGRAYLSAKWFKKIIESS